jgi:hypothetical protein
MIQMRDSKIAEITRNEAMFSKILPTLLGERQGQYALMRDEKIIGFYPSAMEAQTEGHNRFSDGRFSIQKVTEEVEHLGRYAYALAKA